MKQNDRRRLELLLELAPANRLRAGRLGIATEVRRVAVLNGPYKNIPVFDEQERVYSDNHRYRASVTLAKVP